MAKLKGKAKAAFLARMNKGRKKAGLRAIGKGGHSNPRKKRRKNPYRYEAKTPVYKTRRSNKFHSAAETAEFARGKQATMSDFKRERDSLLKKGAAELIIMKELGELKSAVSASKKLSAAEKSEKSQLVKFAKQQAAAEKFKQKIEAEGGKVSAQYSKNPRKRRKKKVKKAHPKRRRKHAKKAKAPKRSRRRKSRRKHARKEKYSSAHVMKQAKSFRVGKGRKKRKVRVKTITVVGNPLSIASAAPLLWAAGGYVAALALYKGIDAAAKGALSVQMAKLPPQVAPLVLPALGIGMGMGMQKAAEYIPGNAGSKIRVLGRGAVMVGGVLGALAVVNIAWGYAKQYIPASVASMPVIGPMLSGVMYFPGMHGADFGMYPQMGDGYQQTPGDFGGIPRGMSGIPRGMGDVAYFPNKAMGEVQFYPPGADGDRMFRESEEGQLMEAEGLGGMGSSVDFGEVPDGMGGGHMG